MAISDPRIDAIFFEKQEGQLCAQHCVNALLQGQYFTAVDLASIAHKLDEQERLVFNDPNFESQNMDDSGFFSVQVVTEALQLWDLQLIPTATNNPQMREANENPTMETAFICNMREHWFTIRKLGLQFFNVNSMLSGPELISDLHLHMFLTQLRTEGYSIFIVRGVFPPCIADELLTANPIDPTVMRTIVESRRPANIGDSTATKGRSNVSEDDPELAEAIRLSALEADANDESLRNVLNQTGGEDEQLKIALAMSLQNDNIGTLDIQDQPPAPVDAAEVRDRRQAFLAKLEMQNTQTQ